MFMEFNELLNNYIETIHCTGKELAQASSLSATVISRYRTGERKPSIDSEHLQKLVSGIVAIAKQKGIVTLQYSQILTTLQDALKQDDINYDIFVTNYDAFITSLNVNMKVLSASTNYDTSYLYRMRQGQRRPTDLKEFGNNFVQFIVTHYDSPEDKERVAAFIGVPIEQLKQQEDYIACLENWLYLYNAKESTQDVSNFLNKLDEFNLGEFIKAIHFDELKVPTMPFQFPTSKSYYGVEEMKKGELDFFKASVLSKSTDSIFMCSDMPMADMAEDTDFAKKWMFAIAMSLKKGLHLNIIHNVDRPFHEMMLGLESWIPIYMTGQVSPYHLPQVSTNVYHHFNYVSGTVALTGECINGYHNNGKYYLTNNKEEVAYYRQKSIDLLSKAQPLMEIYTSSQEKEFLDFLSADAKEAGTRHNILSSLPIYTISKDLLERILTRHKVSEQDKTKLRNYIQTQATLTKALLQENNVTDEITVLSKEDFEKHPLHLSLSGAFFEFEITYTYEEYMEHLNLTREYMTLNPNYTLKEKDTQVFRNIQIHILENKYVLLSKEKNPAIHFVIHHPKMVSALNSFIAPVVET